MVLRVLVTGSGGIVGSHVVNALQSRGESIEIVCFYGDLTDSANTKAFIKEAGKLDTVIHLGAVFKNTTTPVSRTHAITGRYTRMI